MTTAMWTLYGVVEEVFYDSVLATMRENGKSHPFDEFIAHIPIDEFPARQRPVPMYAVENRYVRKGDVFEVTILNDNLRIEWCDRVWSVAELERAGERAKKFTSYFTKGEKHGSKRDMDAEASSEHT